MKMFGPAQLGLHASEGFNGTGDSTSKAVLSCDCCQEILVSDNMVLFIRVLTHPHSTAADFPGVDEWERETEAVTAFVM